MTVGAPGAMIPGVISYDTTVGMILISYIHEGRTIVIVIVT
jgi:hypothetical protein